jgi:hypothetical protein
MAVAHEEMLMLDIFKTFSPCLFPLKMIPTGKAAKKCTKSPLFPNSRLAKLRLGL